MLAHALEESDLAGLDPRDFVGEWKWDGIRVQAVAAADAQGELTARLYSRTGEDISRSFPDLVAALRLPAALDGELLVVRDGRVQSFNVLQQRLNREERNRQAAGGLSRAPAGLRSPRGGTGRFARPALLRTATKVGTVRRAARGSRVSIFPRWSHSPPGTSSPPRARIRPLRAPAKIPMRSKASCSSDATRPMCRVARRALVEMEARPLHR